MKRLIGVIRTPPPEDLPTFIHGFDSFTVTAYFNLLFIAIESAFPTFYKANNVPHAFFDVYKNLLSKLNLARYLDLMNILRLIRNALMHTNGVHTDNMSKFVGVI
jgi:hypothetical protein